MPYIRGTIALFAIALGGCYATSAPQSMAADFFPADDAAMRTRLEAPRAAASVQLAEVEVTGGDVPNANVVAQTMVPQFRACQMRWAPRARGAMRVSAKVG